jgi:hypothetical protein
LRFGALDAMVIKAPLEEENIVVKEEAKEEITEETLELTIITR